MLWLIFWLIVSIVVVCGLIRIIYEVALVLPELLGDLIVFVFWVLTPLRIIVELLIEVVELLIKLYKTRNVKQGDEPRW